MEAPRLVRRMVAGLLPVLVAAAAAPAAARTAEPQAREASHKAVRVTTVVDPKERGRRIARNFLGFSYEVIDVPFRLAHPIFGVNEALARLIDNLTASGGGAPVLRIGGGSQDEAWWNPDGHPRPVGIKYDLNPSWADSLASFATRTRSPLIVGLNLVQSDPSIAAETGRELMRRLPRRLIRSFEIGNEPDIYDRRGIGFVDGRGVKARPPGYDAADYLREIDDYILALRRQRPRPPISGPGASCTPEWCGDVLRALLRKHGPRLREVTFHTYATSACVNREADEGDASSRTEASIPLLLSGAALRSIGLYQEAVRIADRWGLPVRVSETNSAVCGGAPGVSDTFAAALWSLDWMFALAANGVDGVNFHSTSVTYAPIATGYVDGRSQANAQPLYYGLLLFSRAVRRGARILLLPTLGTRRSAPAQVNVWATIDSRRALRIVVVNKDARRAHMRITVPRSRRTGVVTRLRARSLDAKGGVTLGGQRAAVPTFDGRLLGKRKESRVRPRRGNYEFTVPAGSAAMLTVYRVPRR